MPITWASRPRTSPRSGRSRASSRIKFATLSQQKASAAQKAGKFKDEIVAVTVPGRKGDTIVENDEYIKHDATVEGAAKLARRVQEGRHRHRGQRVRHQ